MNAVFVTAYGILRDMKNFLFRFTLLGLFLGSFLAPGADAQVMLRLTPLDGDPVTVSPGGTFRFTVSIEVQGSEQIDSFGYYLNAMDNLNVAVSDDFSILDRVSNTALFSASDLFWTDAEVATPPDSLLAPSNGLDLGAALTNSLPGPGIFLLGTYTLQAAVLAPPGGYQISPIQAIWVSEGTEFSFNEVDSLSVTVIPEPSSGLLLLGSLGLIARRGTRSRRS